MTGPPVHVTPDEVHAHPHRTGHGVFDIAITLLAVFISGVSLFVAFEHGKTERDLVAANSWPFLRQIRTNGVDAQNNLAIGYSNGGVGPAKVHSFEVFYQGRPVRSGIDLLERCCGLTGADKKTISEELPRGFSYSIADDTVIRQGEDNVVLLIRRTPKRPQIPDRFDAALKDITFSACYCSILDECWISNLQTTLTRPVKACPAPAHPFDPNGK
jgi:hypothetical protein